VTISVARRTLLRGAIFCFLKSVIIRCSVTRIVIPCDVKCPTDNVNVPEIYEIFSHYNNNSSGRSKVLKPFNTHTKKVYEIWALFSTH
jgi:hypothetical protein